MKTQSLKTKRIISVISFLVVVALVSALAMFIWNGIKNDIRTPEGFKTYIESFGWKGYLVALGIQVLQVFVAFIPGEFVEIGAGCAFGWFGGTLICLLGISIATSAVFLLTKRFGIKMVSLFVDPAKIDNLRFLNSEKKLKFVIFLLFFIPGTPKDILTYFIGLTRIRLGEFLALSLIARIPSVLSSALVGYYVMEENYKTSIVVFGITALISVCGIVVYNKMLDRKQQKQNNEALK